MGRRPNTQIQNSEVEVEKEEKTTVVDTPEVEVEKEEKRGKKEARVIPDSVDAILKSYSDYPRLYVNLKGGVFTEGTPEYIRKDAVLYENKYYINK